MQSPSISTIFLLAQLGKYWLKHNPVQWVTLSVTSEPVLERGVCLFACSYIIYTYLFSVPDFVLLFATPKLCDEIFDPAHVHSSSDYALIIMQPKVNLITWSCQMDQT